MLVGRSASEHLREVDSDTELRHEEMKPFIDKRECKERERQRAVTLLLYDHRLIPI